MKEVKQKLGVNDSGEANCSKFIKNQKPRNSASLSKFHHFREDILKI